jgi:Asp-tRNA(Asn)/Glu-tRNA(Gln) amidotransferase A subunit family amidase
VTALHDLTATQALAAMRRGEFCAVDYVTALLERAETCAHLNAFFPIHPAHTLPLGRNLFTIPGHRRLSGFPA